MDKLYSRHRFTERRSPRVEMLQALAAQRLVLQIPLHGVQLGHAIGYGRTRGEHHTAPAGQLVQIPALHKQVRGFLRLRLCEPRDVAHLCDEEQVLVVMRLVHEQPVCAQLLKRHQIILARLIVELIQLEFNGLPRLLHLLYGKPLRLGGLGVGDTKNDLVQLLLQHGLLPLDGQRYLFKLAVSNDHGVVVAGGDASAKLLPVSLFKVLFGGHQYASAGVELQELRRPLLCESYLENYLNG